VENMYGPEALKVGIGASVALCALVSFSFPLAGVVLLPLALSNVALLVCEDDFRYVGVKARRWAKIICRVSTVLNVSLFFLVLWLAAALSPFFLIALTMPAASLMRVHEIERGLKGLGPRRGPLQPASMGQDDRRRLSLHRQYGRIQVFVIWMGCVWLPFFLVYLAMEGAGHPADKEALDKLPWFLLSGVMLLVVYLWAYCRKSGIAAAQEEESSSASLPSLAQNAEEVDFMQLMTKTYGFSEVQARAIDMREKRGHESRAAYWAAQGWTGAERARKAFDDRAAASYAGNPALRDDVPVRARGRYADGYEAWIVLLIWAPLAYYGTVWFLRGEFELALPVQRCMALMIALAVLGSAWRVFFRMRQGHGDRLSRTTWLGMLGVGFSVVLGPALVLLPALYGGAYAVHQAVASAETAVYQIELLAEKGRYRSSYAVVDGLKLCFQSQHRGLEDDMVRVQITRSPLGRSAQAYDLDGTSYASYCYPRVLPGRW